MAQDGPPIPPRENTSAALAAYGLAAYYWELSRRIGDDEEVEVSFVSPDHDPLTVITVQPIDETSLMLETYDRANLRHVVFMPCAPLDFTFRVTKKGSATAPRPIGFQTTRGRQAAFALQPDPDNQSADTST